MPEQRIDNLGAAGLNSDVLPTLLPPNVMTTMTNVVAEDGSLASIVGERLVFDPADGVWDNRPLLAVRPEYHVTYIDFSQSQWVIIAGAKVATPDEYQVFAYNIQGGDPAGIEITPTDDGTLTGTAAPWLPGRVSFAILNGVLVVNSTSNGLFYWQGTDVPLTQAPGPGDDAHTWLEGSGAPSDVLGVDGDWYLDTDTENPGNPASESWYVKGAGTWALAGAGDDLPYGWRWRDGWRCEQIAAYRYQLVALRMTEDDVEYVHKTRWSNSAQEGALPTQWAILLTNDAGDDILGETPGRIIGGTNVRDQLMIVKEDSVFGLRYIGGQYVNQVTRLQGGVGTRNPRGFCEMRGALVVMTTSDVYVFDGQNSRSILDARARKAAFALLSEGSWDAAQCFYDSYTSRLYLAYPTQDGMRSLQGALVYNLEEDTYYTYLLQNGWGFDLAFANASVSGAPTYDDFPQGELCDEDPNNPGEPINCVPTPGYVPGAGVGPPWDPSGAYDTMVGISYDKQVETPSVPDLVMYESDAADTKWWLVKRGGTTNSDGSAKLCRVGRTGLPVEGAHGIAQLNWCWPETTGGLEDDTGETPVEVPLAIRFGSQETEEGEVSWDPVVQDIYPGSTQTLDPRVSGRFLAWEVESNGIGSWRLAALTLGWEPAGRR